MLSPIVRGPRTILSVAGRSMVGRLASTTAVVPESSVRTKDELPGTAQHMENRLWLARASNYIMSFRNFNLHDFTRDSRALHADTLDRL